MSYELTAPSGRYDPDLEPSKASVDVVETGQAHTEPSIATFAGETSSRQFSLMLTAASTLAKHCSENAEDLFDVHDVSAFLNLPLTAAHGLIDVLDVLEVCLDYSCLVLAVPCTDTILADRNKKFYCADHPSSWESVPVARHSSSSDYAAVHRKIPRCVSQQQALYKHTNSIET